ncbi:MAG: tetratricopeptide repeat protein [Candidatus Eremiobacterota bacterium]
MIDDNNFKNLLERLINKGKEKGFLTYDEIDDILDEGLDTERELSEEEVEQLYDILTDKSVEIFDITDEAEYYNNLGLLYYGNNDLIQARENFEKVLALKQDFSEGHLNLALIYREQNNILKSLRHLKLCIKHSKNEELKDIAGEYIKKIEDGSYKEDKDEGYYKTVRPEEENLTCEIPSQKNTDELNKYIEFAVTCKEHGDTDKALEYYKKILAITPDEARYYLDIALIYKEVHEYEEALEYLKKCAKKATDTGILSEAKNYISVIENLSSQGESDKENNVNIEEKIKNCETLLEETDSDITRTELYIKLAGFYKEIKNFNKAIGYYKDYLKINKNDGSVHMHLALLYKEQKNIFNALKHFRYCVKRTDDEYIKKQAEACIKEIEDFSEESKHTG